MSSSFVRLKLVGSNPNARVVALDKLKGKSNYFIGNDPKKWRTNVPNYGRVMVKDVYPGIDQIFYGKDGQVEYDFIVHPGASPDAIQIMVEDRNSRFEAGRVKIADNGDLLIPTGSGDVRLGKPVVYQLSPAPTNRKSAIENRKWLDCHYVLSAKNELSIAFGSYDPTRELVIDPTLNYLATFGGSIQTQGYAVAVDSSQNAYVTGATESPDFPTTLGVFMPTCVPNAQGYCNNAYVRKLGPSGAVVYSTYLGGSNFDVGYGISIDQLGDAYVTGYTRSADFPVVSGFQSALAGVGDAFITELDPTGSALVYSSYLGGAGTGGLGDQSGRGIAVDPAGNAYLTGSTNASDFPTLNAFQPLFGGGQCGTVNGVPQPCSDTFVTKVAAGGGGLVYSTFLGGSGDDVGTGVAGDAGGNAYVVGFTESLNFPVLNPFQSSCALGTYNGVPRCQNAFVSELDAAGSALVFSTYLGGSGVAGDNAHGVALDSAGNIYVTGETASTDFPTANAFQPNNASVLSPTVAGADAFVTEFAPGGATLVYSTYLGGSADDVAYSIGVDSLGEAFVTGFTDSTDFPVANAIQATVGTPPTAGVGWYDAFVAGIQAGGKGLIYSTYLGDGGQSETSAYGIAVDAQGDAWVTGASNATTFVAAISRPEVVRREVAPTAEPNRNRPGAVGEGFALPRAAGGRPYVLRPEQSSSSGVTAALAGSIALDMARVHAAPASLAFGAEVAGTTSAPETVTISNPGTVPLTFSAISASDSFAVPSGGSCSTSSSVAPGGNCTVDVAFAPTVGGNLTGTLTLTDNGIGSPHSVALSGIGQDFTLGTDRSSATLKAGVTATILLSVAPQGGFNHPLDFTCHDPAPHSTCSINPASVTPNPASGATVAVSITTTAPGQVAPRLPLPGRPRGAPLLMALAMLALLAVAAASRRGRPRVSGAPWIPAFAGMTSKRHGAALLALALALLLVLAWAACGGGGQPGTPAGTYTVMLKAADAQANLSHSTTVTLTVQ